MAEEAVNYDRLRQLIESDPEAFKRLMKAVNKKTVIPHAAQRPVLDHPARFKVMNCGRRFGKTVIAAKILVKMARREDQMLWWVAPTYKIVKRGYAEVLRQLPDGVLTHDAPPESNFDAGRSVILRFKNGTKMEFYSAERPEGMLGAGVHYVVMDEASKMPSRVWNQIISPTLIDYEGSCLMISTPNGHNWFYRCWQRGQDPQQTEWMSWTFTTQDNPTLPPGEADRMAADMPRMEADQEIYAKFISAGSSVFHVHEKSVMRNKILKNGLIEGCPPKGYVSLGIDLARTNDYTVLYGDRMSDRRVCYFERMNAITWPEQKRRVRRAVRTLLREGAEHVMLIVDSTGVGDPVAEDLESEGYDVVPINFTTHKTNMVRLLAKDLEEPGHAFVLEDGQFEEFQSYGMTLSPAGRMMYSAPEGEHDDVVSAKMLSHWGVINEGMGDVTLLTPETKISRDPFGPVEEEGDLYDDIDEDLDEEDDFSDLLDDEPDEAAMRAVQLVRQPSPEELLLRPDLWF